MKVIFKYLVIDNSERGLPPRFYFQPEAVNAPKEGFEKYLLPALESDYPAYSPELIEKTLHKIDQLERGEIDDYATGGSNDGLVHYLSRESVSFEHQLFYGYPEWPIWSCTLAQYKAALQGWRKFIDMPKSIDSELIIELPDGTP